MLPRIVAAAPEWLRPGGALALEFGDAWQLGVSWPASAPGGTEVRNDLTGRPRVVWAALLTSVDEAAAIVDRAVVVVVVPTETVYGL